MGKYTNIAVASLKSAISTALNELSSYNFQKIQANLTNPAVLQSSVTSVIGTSLGEIQSSSKTGSVSTLKKNLTTLNTACTSIEKIQKLETEIKTLQAEVNELEKHKYKTVTYTTTDSEGNTYTETDTVLDQGVVNKINAKNSLIQSKTKEMTQLEKTVDSLLNS